MSNSVKLILAMGVAAFIGACSQQNQPPETVVVEPVVAETPQTKY